jgi:hypothetical protein
MSELPMLSGFRESPNKPGSLLYPFHPMLRVSRFVSCECRHGWLPGWLSQLQVRGLHTSSGRTSQLTVNL